MAVTPPDHFRAGRLAAFRPEPAFLVGAFLADVFLTNVFRVRLADDLRAALVMVRPSRISVPGQDKA